MVYIKNGYYYFVINNYNKILDLSIKFIVHKYFTTGKFYSKNKIAE